MKKKVLNVWLSCVALLLACLLMLAGCTTAVKDPEESGQETDTTPVDNPTDCQDHRGDFICVTCGERLTPDNFFTNLAVSELENDMILTLDNVELSLPMFNIQRLSIQTGELSLTVDENGDITGFGHLEYTFSDDPEGEDEFTLTGSATVRDGAVFIEAECGWDAGGSPDRYSVYFPLESLSTLPDDTNMQGVLSTVLAQLPELMQTQILPMVKELLAAHPELEDACARSADLLYTLTRTENGYTVSLSMEKLIALVDAFETMTVPELYDRILGEGKFDALKAYALGVFDKTVAELLDECKAEGLDIDRILDMIEPLLPQDDSGNTVLTTVRAMLADEEFLATTVQELLLQTKPGGDGAPTDEEYIAGIRQQISMMFSGLKDTSIWDLIESTMGSMLPGSDPEWDPAMVGTSDLKNQVKALLDSIKDGVRVTYTVSADGKLVSAEIVLDLPDMLGTGTISLVTSYQSTIDYDQVAENVQAEVSLLVTDKLAAALLQYYNEDCQDYEAVYDTATGQLTVKGKDTYGDMIDVADGKAVYIEITDQSVRVVDLKALIALMIEEKCKDISSFDAVYGLVSCEAESDWTAYWINEDGEQGAELTDTEKKTYGLESYFPDSDVDGNVESIFEIRVTLNTATGAILAVNSFGSSYHTKGELVETDPYGVSYYRCAECGRIFGVYDGADSENNLA